MLYCNSLVFCVELVTIFNIEIGYLSFYLVKLQKIGEYLTMSFQMFSIIAIFVITIVSGILPFVKKAMNPEGFSLPIGEALANGVFLGAGLIHMLGDSSSDFAQLNDYPFAFLIAGAVILFFLLMEHIGSSLAKNNKDNLAFMAVMATIMLSVHSFFTGASLGVSNSLGLSIVIFIAIIAHKWAASFALSICINKTKLSISVRLLLYIVFALMAPLGIVFGSGAQEFFGNNPYIQPVLTAIAAGTFIYMGTLHGLERSILIKDCCNLKQYGFVILGFALMAVVAIWT